MLAINSRDFFPAKLFIRCGIEFNKNYSTVRDVPINVPEPVLSAKNSAQFKKGSGGRASFSGNVVTVFGQSGFAGLRVVNRLAKHGNQLILPYRCDSYFVRERKVVGELGQILFFPFQLKDEESIRKAVKHSNVVINLIGANYNTNNYSMYDTNVEGARRIARISREMGVERLIHVSAMGADPEHKSRYVKNGSFLKSKGLGELAVRDEFPSATIVRPSVMYGEGDQFLCKMISYWRRNAYLNVVYVYNGGKGIYKMPLFVNDFSHGIARAAMDPIAAGKTYEFVGPHCYEMTELVDYIYKRAGLMEELGYNYRRTSWPDPYFLVCKWLCQIYIKIYRNNNCFINPEWLDFVEATSDVLTGGSTLTLKDLGVNPAEFENKGGQFCVNYSFVGELELSYSEQPDPPLPLRSPPLTREKQRRFSAADVQTVKRAYGLEKVPSPAV